MTFKSKSFDFINLPKLLRSKKVDNNLPFNVEVSDIPMVIYNLNSSIRSTHFNYKDPNSIKCCCKQI